MEEALRARLLATAGVTALVGQRVTWKIRARGSALPAIVLHLISVREDTTHDGLSGLSESRVQVDCIADTHFAALAVRRAVKAAMGGYRGPDFQAVFVAAQRDDVDTGDVNNPVFRTSLDLMVWHAAA
jgi:hypothetical protein